MRSLARLGLLVLFGLAPATALAGEPTHDPPDKAKPDRVHLGATSVTVVDEHEPVDDVISRIRRAENDSKGSDKTKADHEKSGATSTAAGQNTTEGRAALRGQRERSAGRADSVRVKDQKRERAASTRTRLEEKKRR